MSLQSPVSIDLMEAARRSESFPREWSDEQTKQAIGRYEQFLRLAAANPGRPLAPTREIDTIWHLHMLSPRAYYNDCQRLFGNILDHDGGFGKLEAEIPVLKATFEETARLWEEAFGEPYGDSSSPTATTKCWHNCKSTCWHACKSNQSEDAQIPSSQ